MNIGMKKAFTLAEVLITLGIIGIVAAMTMPSLMANYKTHVRNQQFKKSYSTMANAIKMVEAELGELPNCYYRDGQYDASYFTECSGFYDELVKKMKVIKTCKGNALANGCIPQYNDVPVSGTCTGFSLASIVGRSHSYVLTDGSIIITYGSSATPTHGIFAVDLNGKKLPNQWGHDVFPFMLDNSTSTYLRPGGCNPVENKGLTSVKMFEEVIYK